MTGRLFLCLAWLAVAQAADSSISFSVIDFSSTFVESAIIVLSPGETRQLLLRDALEVQVHLYNECEGAVHVHNYGEVVLSGFIDSDNTSSFVHSDVYGLFIKCATGDILIHTSADDKICKNKLRREFQIFTQTFSNAGFITLVVALLLGGALFAGLAVSFIAIVLQQKRAKYKQFQST